MTKRAVLLLLTLLLLSVTFQALDAQGSDPNDTIQWPPPTYVLSGSFAVRGSANVADMRAYFLEFRPLIDSVTPAGVNVLWSPATLPAPGPVLNDVLGVWDTTRVSDGLYELRLTILTNGGSALYARVSPLRIENHPPSFAIPVTLPTQIPGLVPTLLPTFTPPAVNPNPSATAQINANVRLGDSTIFAAIGALFAGQQAPLLGVSSTGSGWWLIQLPDGRTGWIAPSVVQVTGDLNRVPRVDPPPPPTPTPTPTPTATPIVLPDAIIFDVHFDHPPKVGVPFNVIINVSDQSPVPLPGITVACNFTPMNVFVSSVLDTLAGFGQNAVVIPAQIDTGGGTSFNTACAVDVNNLVPEISETNNFFTRTDILEN